MAPEDDIVCTPVFTSDCAKHGLPGDEVRSIKTVLLLNPEYGKRIEFAKAGRRRLPCGDLRTFEWAFNRNGALVKGHVLYLFTTFDFPMFLLRLEVDDGKLPPGPFVDPIDWPRWIDRIIEIAELAAKASAHF
jgi:hypothetical protein